MDKNGKVKRPPQQRVTLTRQKVVNGAIAALATHGVTNLTHRVVARAAGVSLAATTYHYATKQDILVETSQVLLAAYLEAFQRLEQRLRSDENVDIRTLDELIVRIVGNALGRDRERSLAWCQLMLDGGRSADGRLLAQRWYTKLDEIWTGICDRLQTTTGLQPGAAIDLTVGLIVLLHPLDLNADSLLDLLNGRASLSQFSSVYAALRQETDLASSPDNGNGARNAATRERLVEATIEILIKEGTAAVTYASVADRAGMVRSGPSYYFPTISGLLRAAQITLFARAKARYREGIESIQPQDIDEQRLIDLTTAVFFHELFQSPHENLGYYSVWMSAAQNLTLRAAVFESLYDQNRAWQRRLIAIFGDSVPAPVPLWIQGLFAGKLIRGIAAQPATGDLARSREDFAAMIRSAGA